MKRKIHLSNLSVRLLTSAVLFGIIMFSMNSFMSYRQFKNQVESLYANVTTQFASTAVSYIDAERIFYWLTFGNDSSWDSANQRLNELTETAELAFIYLTVVSKDYKKRTYVFDTVNSLAANKPYELGFEESLEKKTPDYIENLHKIIERGENQSYFSYKNSGGHVTTSIPVRDSTGAVMAIMSVVKPMNDLQTYKTAFLRSTLIAALLFTLFFIFLYALALIVNLIKPLLLIIDETTHFAEHHCELTGVLKKVKSHDELGLLAFSIEKMGRDMNRYIADLTQATAERERLGAELNVATKIQAEMLPRVFPPYENHPEIELFATMNPAKEVGGDFYDFFYIDNNHFAVVVADVSGKGVPAALFMVIAKTLLKDAAYRFKTPAEIFSHVNNILCEGNESGLFVTCWMGILDISSGLFTFANAGHTSPVLFQDGKVSYLHTKPNLMLAAMSDMPYMNHEIYLKPGDRLFIYTDGVTEAADKENRLYGEERLLNIINKNDTTDLTPREFLSYIQSEIDDFVNGAPQFDDITMLAFIFKKKAGENKIREMKIVAHEQNMEKVNDFIHSCLPADCSPALQNKIDLAVEEIFVNIAHYAYNPNLGDVWLSASFTDNELTVVFKDNGKEFNPIDKADPDISLGAEEREIGGLGIFLTKKFMDCVDYKYLDGHNILTIKKKIE